MVSIRTRQADKFRRTASVVAFGGVVGVQDPVVVGSSERVRVAGAEGEVALEVGFEAGEGECREERGGAVFADDRDEVREAGHLAAERHWSAETRARPESCHARLVIRRSHDDLVGLDVICERGIAAEQLDPQVLLCDLVVRTFGRQGVEGELCKVRDGDIK